MSDIGTLFHIEEDSKNGMKRGSKKIYSLIGATNHSDTQREENDLYCTHPKAIEELLKIESFQHKIWEPCDGLGHISETLIKYGHEVRCSDIIIRERNIERINFLLYNGEKWDGDIITNPPYSDAASFVRKAIDVVNDECKVAMWLRILFLESQSRKDLFKEFPPKRVWISSSRIPCGKNGDFSGQSAQAYAWFIWEKGHKGETILNWF